MIDSLTCIIQASLLQLRWLSVVAMLLAALVSPYIPVSYTHLTLPTNREV